jgi:predicted nucleic acid-binding protein
VSNEILLEYEEILRAIGGPTAWSAFESLLIARAAFVTRVDPTYSWKAIVHDPDDDKFVDAAVAGEADWIVTRIPITTYSSRMRGSRSARSIRRSSSSGISSP